MTKEIIYNRLDHLIENMDQLVIDGDTHISDPAILSVIEKERQTDDPNYYHGRAISAEELLAEMKMAGIDMSLVWQNPAATIYPGSQKNNYEALRQANRYIFYSVEKYPGKFIPAGWTDPAALGEELAIELIEECIQEFGFPIVKMNPAQNAFPIDSDLAIKMTGKIISLGAIPAFHYGADTEFTPASGLKELASRFPESPIIAVHMGGGGASYRNAEKLYHQSRSLGLEQENIYYILSSKRETHMESDLITYQLSGDSAKKRLICASDAPYGRQSWNFGGFRYMFNSLMNNELHTDLRVKENPGLFGEEDVRNYLGGNLARLAIKGYRSIADKL